MSPASVARVDVGNGHGGAVQPLIGALAVEVGAHPLDGPRGVGGRRWAVPDEGFIGAVGMGDQYGVGGFGVVPSGGVRQPGVVPVVDAVLLVGVVGRLGVVGNGAHVGRLDGVQRRGALQVVGVVEVVGAVSSGPEEGQRLVEEAAVGGREGVIRRKVEGAGVDVPIGGHVGDRREVVV